MKKFILISLLIVMVTALFAVTKMTRVDWRKTGRISGSSIPYEATVTLTSASVSDWIMVPAGADVVLATFTTTNIGEGGVLLTSDPLADLLAGTASGALWASGIVSNTTYVKLDGVSAIQLSNITGVIKLSLKAYNSGG